jgi:hypothetical protein
VSVACGIGFGVGLVSRDEDDHGMCAQAVIVAQAMRTAIAWVNARVFRIVKE